MLDKGALWKLKSLMLIIMFAVERKVLSRVLVFSEWVGASSNWLLREIRRKKVTQPVMNFSGTTWSQRHYSVLGFKIIVSIWYLLFFPLQLFIDKSLGGIFDSSPWTVSYSIPPHFRRKEKWIQVLLLSHTRNIIPDMSCKFYEPQCPHLLYGAKNTILHGFDEHHTEVCMKNT